MSKITDVGDGAGKARLINGPGELDIILFFDSTDPKKAGH